MIAAETLRSFAPLGQPGRPSVHKHSLSNDSEPHALQLACVEPCDLLAKPCLGAIELVFPGCRCEVARSEQVGNRGLTELAEPVREPASAERRCQNYGLAREIRELAEVFLCLGERLGPAISLAEQGNRGVEIVDTQYDVLDAAHRRSFYAGRSLDAPVARRLVLDDEGQRGAWCSRANVGGHPLD